MDEKKLKIYSKKKRIMDIVLSCLMLIFLWPVFLVIMLCIKFEDPSGTVFFAQQRAGKNGQKFQMYKFRSMIPDAEEKKKDLMNQNVVDRIAFKIQNDPRETKVGHILRGINLDELPQLINVLKGDMSLVGPRPPVLEEVKAYTNYEKQRLSVMPGITCYWQIQPHRHEISFDEWMELDLKYIRERSIKTDMGILIKTLFIFLRR